MKITVNKSAETGQWIGRIISNEQELMVAEGPEDFVVISILTAALPCLITISYAPQEFGNERTH